MKTLLTTSALLFALPANAAQDLTGQWNVHSTVGGNQFDQHCTLTVADNKVTGSCKLKGDDYQVTGVIDGGNATWQYNYDSMNGRPVSFVFKAPLDDPSKIAGSMTVMPFGLKGEFTATPGPELEVTTAEQPVVIHPGPRGLFRYQADIGKVSSAGTASFDAATGSYMIESAGSNLWKRSDSFHMIWRKVSGDVALTADIVLAPPLPKSLAHRKAVLMFRQALNAKSAYADVAVHGSGYTALQYRPSEGAFTQEVPLDQGSPNGAEATGGLAAPKTVRLEKRGDTVALFVSMNGDPPHPAGVSVKLHFEGPFYVGLGVSAHQDNVTETATFSHVKLTPLIRHKGEARRKISVVHPAASMRHGA